MAQDPKRNLPTLSGYAYREEKKERERRSIIETFLKADMPERVAFVIVAILFTAMIAFLFYLSDKSPKAIQAQADLEREFKLIPPLPHATAHDYSAGRKYQHASVGAKYTTALSRQDIRNYYDNELTKHGWRFVKEESGGRYVYYRKGNYIAELEYEEDHPGYGFTYSFDLSWGMHDEL